jgi:hypothetical protein
MKKLYCWILLVLLEMSATAWAGQRIEGVGVLALRPSDKTIVVELPNISPNGDDVQEAAEFIFLLQQLTNVEIVAIGELYPTLTRALF